MTKSKRYTILDIIRALALIEMIVYHAMWDLVYIYGVNIPWYKGEAAFIWQQSICWTFILLSGFCWNLGRRKLKRGLIVFGCSILISIVTAIFLPNACIMFGILSLIGTAMLVMIPFDKILCKVNPYIGMIVCFVLFIIFYNVNVGTLGFLDWEIAELPKELYANLFTAYLGFPAPSFYSSDYFSVLPWLFLYQTGYFMYRVFKKKDWLKHLSAISIKPLEWIGRHSLILYMLHQPVVYGVLYVVFNVLR